MSRVDRLLREVAEEHEKELQTLKRQSAIEIQALRNQVAQLQGTTVCVDTYISSDGKTLATRNSAGNEYSTKSSSASFDESASPDEVVLDAVSDAGSKDGREDMSGTPNTERQMPSQRESQNYASQNSDSRPSRKASRPSQYSDASEATQQNLPAHMINFAYDAMYHRKLPHVQWNEKWEFYFAVAIICNAIYIGFRVEYLANQGVDHWGKPAVGLVFCIFFMFELFLRIYSYRGKFFIGPDRLWNVFDTVIITCMVIEELLIRIIGDDNETVDKLGVLTVLRLLRIMRILRATRLIVQVSGFAHARLLLMTITGAARVSFWLLCIFVFMIYMLSLIIADAAVENCVETTSLSFCKHFGSLGQAVSSVYQAFIGAMEWGELFDPLNDLGWGYTVMFVIFVSFFFLILMQIYTGMFVMEVHRVAELMKNEDFHIEHKLQRDKFVSTLMNIFNKLDLNGNGALSMNEIKAAFSHRQVSSQFAQMEVDVVQAEELFQLLDNDGSGQVSASEFVLGCLQLQGKAKSIDLEKVKQLLFTVDTKVSEMNRQLGLTGWVSEATEKSSPRKSSPKTFQKMGKGSARTKSGTQSGTLFGNSEPVTEKFAHAYSVREKIPTRNSLVSRSIQKAELRAMTVSELEDILTVISNSCEAEQWTDIISGKSLTPAQVNLYHFNYYVMSPETSAASVTLKGLVHQSYEETQMLKCVDEKGTMIGEAAVLQDANGSDVRVKLLRGQIGTYKGTKIIDENGTSCGTPTSVINEESLSYKEIVSSAPTKPDWFCCHWWGEPIHDFVSCCLEHGKRRKRRSYWVCAYANRQHDLAGDVEDPDSSSFRRAMKLAEGVLLILDPKATPFQRIWCGYELFTTVADPNKMLDIMTQRSKPRLLTEDRLPGEGLVDWRIRENKFPVKLLAKGLQVKLEDGQSTVPVDKENILNSLGRDKATGLVDQDLMNKNVLTANRHLRSRMAVAAWPGALKEGKIVNFDVNGTEVNLSQILKDDEFRTSLHLDLCHLEEASDFDVALVADSLAPSLTYVNLSFDSCANITDAGVTAFAASLSSLKLKELFLDFGGCAKITDTSVKELAARFPPTLVELTLIFAFCPKVSNAGVQILAQKMPASVNKFKGTFTGTKCDKVFESTQQLKREFKGSLVSKSTLGRF